MSLSESLDNYRSFKKAKRLGICAAIGLLPAGYDWYEKGGELGLELLEVNSQFDTEQGKVARAKDEIKELPKLQEQKSGIEQALEKAKKILPDTIDIEEVVGKVAALEKETGVRLVSLRPNKERIPDANLRYAEVPYDIEVQAEFNRIMVFFDQLLHQDKLVNIRDIKFQVKELDTGKPGQTTNGLVLAKASLVMFRGVETLGEGAKAPGATPAPPPVTGAIPPNIPPK